MAYKYQKNPSSGAYEIEFSGWEEGIAPSPHAGIGNMQGVNNTNEIGEIMCNFGRTLQSQVAGTGTFTQVNSSTVSVSGINLLVGTWVHITNGGTTGLSGDYYYASTGKLSRTFTQSATPNKVPITIMAVGGGAGAGQSGATSGGGGGAGEVIEQSYLVTTSAYTVSIGAGGAVNVNGSDTTFSNTSTTLTATGGVKGDDTTHAGGASGNTNAGGTGGAGDTGGGGGSSGVGVNGSGTTGGNGGPGTTSSISGSPVTYAGGGGGYGTAVAGLGIAGGGNGGTGGGSGSNATANTGSGGGGGAGGVATSGAGGSGILIVSYPTGSLTATGGTITTSGANTIHTFTSGGTFTVTSIAGFVSNISAGTATFSVYSMSKPIQKATERYTASDGTVQYRYYILDDLAQLWVHDTFPLTGIDTPVWFSPQLPFALNGRVASGLSVFNGWVSITLDNRLAWKSTSLLGLDFLSSYSLMNGGFHSALVGHQGRLYYTDGNFVGSIFPNTSLLNGAANIQSYFDYTASTDVCTVTTLIGGSYPNTDASLTVRLPIVFFTDGYLPTSLQPADLDFDGYQVSEIKYLEWSSANKTFQVFDAITGGSALDMQTGAVGTQYANTFVPIGTSSQATVTFTPQRLNLPFYETAQCLAELGNIVIVGCSSNTLYPWDQVSALPNSIIPLPENNTVNLVTVNNLVYAFSGQKGNIYVTNGSSVSIAVSVPDYCAGIAGTPNSYIDPFFVWGDAMYMRGRVWFSVQDQTSTKTGNCGAVWSFIPSNNYSTFTKLGPAMKLENQNTYATYNGASSVLIPSQNQSVVGPQYWAAWYSSITSPIYGIDFTDTIPTTTTSIELDLIPTGTMLEKETFNQIEYKLAVPLVANETITMQYRQNGTDSYQTVGVFITDDSNLSGYVSMNFERGQWLQLKLVLNPVASSSSSFCRLQKVIVR